MPKLELHKRAVLDSSYGNVISGVESEEVTIVTYPLEDISCMNDKGISPKETVELETSRYSDKIIVAEDLTSQQTIDLQNSSSGQVNDLKIVQIHEGSRDKNQRKDSEYHNNSVQTNKFLDVRDTSISGRFQCGDLSIGETESESIADTSQVSGSDSLSVSLKPLKIKRKSKKVKNLKHARDNRDSDSSVCSKKIGMSRKIIVKCKFSSDGLKYIEDCLKGHIFSGWVDERKWIENLGSYRDIVEVDEWEMELNKQFNIIIRKIPGVQEGTKWINITPPSATEPSYCLWVLLDETPIPGHYWFVITGVGVQSQFGLRISLRVIRSLHPQDYEDSDVRKRRKTMLLSSESGNEFETISQQFQDWWNQIKHLNFALVWSAATTCFTPSNIQDAVRFVVILIFTLTVGIMTFFREAHHVVLRFIHEAGIFLHNVTPFMQSLIAFIEKIIGGFYLLVAMVYRDWKRSSTPPSYVPPPSFSGQCQGSLPQAKGHELPIVPSTTGQRVVKYVGPEQWVYKRQNNPAPTS